MKTTQYRRKPTYCTAMRFTKENLAGEKGPIVVTSEYIIAYDVDTSGMLYGIFTNSDGDIFSIQEGDYIVKYDDGITRVVRPWDFEREFEAVE